MARVGSGVRRRARDLIFLFPAALGRLGLVDRERGEEAFDLALALSSGTISVVSRFKGAERHERADFAIKQSL